MPADVAAVAAVLDVLRDRADACDAALLVVGAMARDLVLTTTPARATNDVDFGLAVASAEQVAMVTDGLEPVPLHANKFVVAGIEVDIVPFGAIEAPDRTVRSPDGFVMNVLGYREALTAALRVPLPDGSDALVASLAAQVVLKLAAWTDRKHLTRKDAIDLGALIAEYREDVHVEEMFERHPARMARHGFDPALAAADRIGAEVAALLGDGVRQASDLVARESAATSALPAAMGGDPARNRALLDALLVGLRDG